MPSDETVRVITFLSTVNTIVLESSIRETPVLPDSRFADRNNELIVIRGEVTFNIDSEANRMFNDIVARATIDRSAIEYSVIQITDNTHHYPNPLPDVVTNSDTKGTRSNLDRYTFDI